jgi:arginase
MVGGVGGWTILGVPLYTLADSRGLGDSPGALRKAGLGVVGGGSDLGDVEIPQLKKDVLEGKTKNLTHFREATSRIYTMVRSLQTERVVVVGGECSETVGTMAGLAEAFGRRPGMLWLDAHGDFNTPETSPSGYIGGMCLALACRRAATTGLDLGIGEPPLADERLVHVGSRVLDPAEVVAFNASPAKLYTSQQVKKSGAAEVAQDVARHLDNRSDWIVCHLDVDVIDPESIPSVNYPTPGGLTLEETATILTGLRGTQKLRALELTAYDASKDRSGSSANRIVELMKTVLG